MKKQALEKERINAKQKEEIEKLKRQINKLPEVLQEK